MNSAADPCLPGQTIRARHVGYTRDGIPVVRKLENIACAAGPPEFPGARHFAYTAQGKPRLVYPWECCDALCTDQQVLDGDCYVRPDDFPFGEGPGLSRKLAIHFFDTQTCWSARTFNCSPDKFLEYDDGDGKWHADLDLRGGTLTVVFEVIDPGSVKLTWTGCDSGSAVAAPDCTDPFTASFFIAPLDHCCDCDGPDDGGTTDTPAQITAWVSGNCRRVVWARHVGYTAAGIPVVAKEKPCAWDQAACYACLDMTCPLVATVTSSDPACVHEVGTWDMPYLGGHWDATAGGAPFTFFFMTCADGGADPVHGDPSCGNVLLTLNITCGADSIGSATTIIRAADLEDLDVTFNVAMSAGSDPSCCASTLNVRIMR